jgi:hypothetical protein
MSTDKAVASAAALAELDAVVVVLAQVQNYPHMTIRAVGRSTGLLTTNLKNK